MKLFGQKEVPLRTYQVWLKGEGGAASKSVDVQADDVDLDVAGPDDNPALFWNFQTGNDDSVTVAAFPYLQVDYIVSRPG
jgi:hypothetical protein